MAALTGIVLRIIPYLANRSFWHDEALISLNILNRNYFSLLKPLQYEQGAPPVFLWFSKLSVDIFGNSEYAFRLFPLLCSLLSIYFMYLILRSLFRGKEIVFGLLLFAFTYHLIYFASEMKQYATDVLVSTALLALVLRQRKRTADMKMFFFFLLAGGISIVSSHPSVFILSSIGITMSISGFFRKEYEKMFLFAIVSLAWFVFFGLIYYFIFRHLNQSTFLMTFWQEGFMPFPPQSLADFTWFIKTFLDALNNPMGYTYTGLAAFLFLVGCIKLFKDDKQLFFLLFLPMVIAVLASGLKKFPCTGRLILFLIPVFLIFIMQGLRYVAQGSKHKKMAVYVVVFFLMLAPMMKITLTYIKSPYRHEIRDVLCQLKEKIKPGDMIVIDRLTNGLYIYYAQKFNLPPVDMQFPLDNLNLEQAQIERIKNKNIRVWIIITNIWQVASLEDCIPGYISENGKRVDKIIAQNAVGYCYQFIE